MNNPEPIAITGIGCRFPGGVKNPESFWNLLCAGTDTITEIPTDRWNLKTYFDEDPEKPGKMHIRHGGFLDQIDSFDAHFFGISPREASAIDPQQRLMMQVVWEALEDCGQIPENLSNTRTGVFIGEFALDYKLLSLSELQRDIIGMHTATGSFATLLANRISYWFNLKGPSVSLDTACSSSLVAVHLACQSIWAKESDLALAGGVNLIFKPEWTLAAAKGGFLSPDGRCKSFDEQANGYVRSEGLGVVVLKPLSKALKDEDPVYALIKGTGVNQDGRTSSITIPNGEAQINLIKEVCDHAGVRPNQIQYVEAHGTGTAAGDPIEANAIGTVYGAGRLPENKCIIGSLKSNMGHMEAAAGIAGLIKTALCLHFGAIPPSIHFQKPNPKIRFDKFPIKVAKRLEVFPDNGSPLMAGVNSFGFGGTNAHVIMEKAKNSQSTMKRYENALMSESSPPLLLIPFSAKTPDALQGICRSYLDFLENQKADLYPPDIGYTTARRRTHHPYRLALTANSVEEIQEKLNVFISGEHRRGLVHGRIVEKSSELVFVFSGMGPQWWKMGRQLLEQNEVFKKIIKKCDTILRQYVEWSLLDELTANEADSKINETQIAQPAIFFIQVALSELWKSWGVYPSAIVGHSVGEIAAAHVAGVLSLEDALRVTFHRSRLQQRTAGKGKMLAVGLSMAEMEELLKNYSSLVSVGAVNSPDSVTLSGDTKSLEAISEILAKKDIFCRFLRVEVPYHSPMMEPLKAELVASLKGINPCPAKIPLFSTVTGKQIQGEFLTPEYWAENIRNPVLFANAVKDIINAGYTTFLEISAHPVLGGSVSECLDNANTTGTVLHSLRRKEDEQIEMLSSVAKLYTIGYPIKWDRFYPNGKFTRLPTYSWQEERYWAESEQGREERLGKGLRQIRLSNAVHPLLGSRLATPYPIWNSEPSQQVLEYISDHQIQGSVVYPGAGYSEMAIAAAKEIFGNASCTLSEIHFKKALFLPEDGKIPRLQFIFDSDQENFKIFSSTDEDKWSLHITGEMTPTPHIARKVSFEINAIRNRCQDEISVKECYEKFYRMGFEYGIKFQGIHRFWKGNKEAFAQICLPDVIEHGDDGYFLHPVILDSCFQTFLGAAVFEGAEQTTYLPARTERFGYYGHPDITQHLWCYARLTSHDTARLIGDIELFDDAGNLLTEIRGFLCQSLETMISALDAKQDWLYEFQWENQALPVHESADTIASSESLKPQSIQTGSWLIFADTKAPWCQLAEFFEKRKETAILVSAGKEYKQFSSTRFSIRPENPEDMNNMLETVFDVFPGCKGVIHLWSASIPCTYSTIQDYKISLYSVLHLVQSLTNFEWTKPPALWLVSEKGQAVDTDNETLFIYQAPLWGLGRVIMNERPDYQTRLVDIGSPKDIHALFKEIVTGTLEDEIALRKNARYVRRLIKTSERKHPQTSHMNKSKEMISVTNKISLEIDDPHLLSDQISLQIKKDPNKGFEVQFNGNGKTNFYVQDENIFITSLSKQMIHDTGTYLITGGLSGFGLSAARWMGEQGARHLVLLGRSGITTPEAAEAVENMKQAGIHIKVAKADVTDAEQINKIFTEIAESMPPLKGLIHSANVYDDAVLTDMTYKHIEKVMGPKMTGAWNLHQQTLTLQLDFFVMFSSITSILGNPGQGNYAAANSFLDALSHYRHHMGLPALAINWGAISDTGYAAKDADISKHLDRIGVKGFPSNSAFEILKERLPSSSGGVQIAVADMDWQKWSQTHASGHSPRFSYLVHPHTNTGNKDGENDEIQGNESDFLNQLKGIPVEERKKHVHDFTCNIISQVLGIDPSKPLDTEQGFFEMGLDSMMTIELRSRLIDHLQLTLPTTLAFKYPNINALVAYLFQEINALQFSSDLPVSESNVKNDASIPDTSIITEMEELSEDEAEMLLLDELEQLEIKD
ncbi:MAG: SDR family NAD(P)-dependent oxidoreductase [Candidatus Magnetomorum sp.]|nr:SDR family NAD(P)-dependent oxidoreductase [Candidatus Magnetomorum sp.]